MKNLISFLLVFSLWGSRAAFSISTAEADKFVNHYESFSHRTLNFINCLSRVITGSDAIILDNPPQKLKVSQSGKQPDSFEGCINQAGFKTSNAFFKLIPGFGKEADPAQAPSNLGNLGKRPTAVAPVAGASN